MRQNIYIECFIFQHGSHNISFYLYILLLFLILPFMKNSKMLNRDFSWLEKKKQTIYLTLPAFQVEVYASF